MKLLTNTATSRPYKRGAHVITETILYEIHADERSLNAFAFRASRNRSGKAVKGPFICKIITKAENGEG